MARKQNQNSRSSKGDLKMAINVNKAASTWDTETDEVLDLFDSRYEAENPDVEDTDDDDDDDDFDDDDDDDEFDDDDFDDDDDVDLDIEDDD
jgi:hypothetical protein